MGSSINGMAERFRSFLDEPGPIELPGCYDVLSAMLLEEAGFASVFLSGYGAAASLLGNPDIGLTTLSETSALAKNLIAAINVPVVVDADNGYGNEDNVVRTVFELEHAGAAAMVMEDQVLPKRCGHAANKTVLPLHLYMRKLECALAARRTTMPIIARTDAMNLDEAIARAKAFHSAGADVTLIDGLQSLDAARRFAHEVPGPKQINLIHGGRTPLRSVAELHELGFKVILYSTPALFAVTSSLRRVLARLAETHDLRSIADASVGFDEFQQFIEARYERRPHSRGLVGERGVSSST
jgi:2-methylisocitrate lyase-like PEP mutase family enzyme